MTGLKDGRCAAVRMLLNVEETVMAIETIGNYQLHLIAYELSPSGLWDPFVTILKFDEQAQDFKCVIEKHHASEKAFASYDEAIDQARRAGTALIEAGKV